MFTKLDYRVVDAFPGTFSVTKGFILLINLRRFIGCEVDTSCIIKRYCS